MTCNFFQGKQTKKLHSIKSCFFSSCLFVIFPHRLKYNLMRKDNSQSKLLISSKNNTSSYEENKSIFILVHEDFSC